MKKQKKIFTTVFGFIWVIAVILIFTGIDDKYGGSNAANLFWIIFFVLLVALTILANKLRKKFITIAGMLLFIIIQILEWQFPVIHEFIQSINF